MYVKANILIIIGLFRESAFPCAKSDPIKRPLLYLGTRFAEHSYTTKGALVTVLIFQSKMFHSELAFREIKSFSRPRYAFCHL